MKRKKKGIAKKNPEKTTYQYRREKNLSACKNDEKKSNIIPKFVLLKWKKDYSSKKRYKKEKSKRRRRERPQKKNLTVY